MAVEAELSGRKKKILKAVVELYVKTAEPVGSKAIASALDNRVSSATIRNEMAELEEQGYLEKPHTSAGRIPSPKCYRLYVNELMERQQLSAQETESINRALQMKLQELDRILSRAGQVVSHFTQYPVYALAAGRKQFSVARFDLLRVDEQSFIAVVMTDDGRVKSKLLYTQVPVDMSQLPVLAALLNKDFVGQTPEEMGKRLMVAAGQVPALLFMVLSLTVEYAGEVLEEIQHRMVYTAGANRILDLPEYQDVGKAGALMRFLGEEDAALPVPEDNAPMQILIGPENVEKALQDSSVVVASYDIGEDMRGLIGVVGPTRMDYATVAARLAYFADGLGRMFDHKKLPEHEEDVTT
ncbi:heat-inducible transcriptional repressor HrcA [bacterium 210917-DFI.7.65]|nr:heat-inducible transcription repressor HrcA [Clostridiales bacterium]MCB6899516.1 heat-inducible transcriptional repressor HrcA [bacterium 210917-DFI.7.65]